MEKTLLYVTFWHPSGGGTGVHRTIKLTRQLAAAGWGVTVLSGPAPAGAGDDGTANFESVTARGFFAPKAGPTVVAPKPPAATSPDRPSWLRARLREAVFFPDPQILWTPSGFAAARRALRGRRVSLVFCSGPPFSVFLLGRMLASRFRAPLVLDYRDVWLDHPWWPVPGWRKRADAWLERRILSRAQLVIANHERMKEMFLARNPQIAGRCLVLPNGYDPEELGPPVRPAWRPGQRFEIVYSGTLYGPVEGKDTAGEPLSVQRPGPFLEALRRLSDRGAFGPGGVHATFVGAKPWTREAETLSACARQCGVESLVEILPRMDKKDTVPIIRRAHLLLNILYYTEAQVAQKIYDYIHLEIPVLSLLRDTRPNEEITRRAGAGPIVDPGDTPGIASAIESILSAYERGTPFGRGDRAFIETFDVRGQAALLAQRLDQIVHAWPAPGTSR